MKLYELPTPFVAVDMEKLKRNIREASEKAKKNGKELFPMVKTHKSLYVAKLQREAGAKGFVCGTVDEAEMLARSGVAEMIMMGYPLADRKNIERVIHLMEENVRVIFRIDNIDGARILSRELQKRNLKGEYVIKIDVGAHRFGILPEKAVNLARRLREFSNLKFLGIVTHPGQAYAANTPEEVRRIAKDSTEKMRIAYENLKECGLDAEIIGTGSTPTFRFDVEEELYTHLFPGNYVYYDREQALVYGSTEVRRAALTVFASILSIWQQGRKRIAIINAGSTYFDKRRHITIGGFGEVIEHPGALLIDLSQEVGKLDISEISEIEVGEKVSILPNHACITNNSTSYIVAHTNHVVRGIIPVDARNGGNLQKFIL